MLIDVCLNVYWWKLYFVAAKTVLCNASKRMLCSQPPPILTIHLKRFQQVRMYSFILDVILVTKWYLMYILATLLLFFTTIWFVTLSHISLPGRLSNEKGQQACRSSSCVGFSTLLLRTMRSEILKSLLKMTLKIILLFFLTILRLTSKFIMHAFSAQGLTLLDRLFLLNHHLSMLTGFMWRWKSNSVPVIWYGRTLWVTDKRTLRCLRED